MKIQDKLDTIIQKLEGLCTQSGQISGPVAGELKGLCQRKSEFF